MYSAGRNLDMTTLDLESRIGKLAKVDTAFD